MKGTGKRIKRLRAELELNQGEFADRIELVQSALSAIESDKKPLTDRNLKLICHEFGVSEPWLRSGEGDMFNKKTALEPVIFEDNGKPLSNEEGIFIANYRKLIESNKLAVRTTVDALLKSQGESVKSKRLSAEKKSG